VIRGRTCHDVQEGLTIPSPRSPAIETSCRDLKLLKGNNRRRAARQLSNQRGEGSNYDRDRGNQWRKNDFERHYARLSSAPFWTSDGITEEAALPLSTHRIRVHVVEVQQSKGDDDRLEQHRARPCMLDSCGFDTVGLLPAFETLRRRLSAGKDSTNVLETLR